MPDWVLKLGIGGIVFLLIPLVVCIVAAWLAMGYLIIAMLSSLN